MELHTGILDIENEWIIHPKMKFVIMSCFILFHQTCMILLWKIKDDTLKNDSLYFEKKCFLNFFFFFLSVQWMSMKSIVVLDLFDFHSLEWRKSYTFGTTCLTNKFSKVSTFSIFFFLRKWAQLSQYQVCVAGRQTKTQNVNIPIRTLIQTGNNPKRAEKHT